MALWLSISALLAAVALPAAATAGEPQIDPASGGFPVNFVGTGVGTLELRFGITVSCTSYKSAGKFTSATTGTIETTFAGCLFVGSIACTTPGQPVGTITFSESVFHLVYLTDSKTTPGVLVTPPAGGVFSTVSCLGEIKGSGYMARLEAPSCFGKSAAFSFTHETSAHSTQKYRQVTGTGSLYNLTNPSGEGALVATNTWTLAQQATLTCV